MLGRIRDMDLSEWVALGSFIAACAAAAVAIGAFRHAGVSARAASRAADAAEEANSLSREALRGSAGDRRHATRANVVAVEFIRNSGLVVRNNGPGLARRVRAEFKRNAKARAQQTREHPSLHPQDDYTFAPPYDDVRDEVDNISAPAGGQGRVARVFWSDGPDGAEERRESDWLQIPESG